MANRADLARVRGVGGVFSDLLEHAGVDTVREFAIRRPDNLYANLVEIIIKMAEQLGLDVIAEGVETQDQLDFLLAKGCRLFQGYYFSHPLSEDDFEKLIREPHNKILSPST